MVRYLTPLIIGKYAGRYLKSGREPSYIITTGAAGERPVLGREIVSAYSGDLIVMAKALALSMKPTSVNVVSPGPVHTELWDHFGDRKQGLLAQIEQKLPTGRVPGPEEVAEAYLYLMKDSNITGATVSTSGGSLLV